MEEESSATSSSNIRDLISASLIAPSQSVERRQQPECDENNNSTSASSVDAEKPSSVSINDDERDEKSEKIKPKQMVGLFPLDLRSELKQRLGGGKVGFALKKSSTSIDVRKKEIVMTASGSVPIPIPNNNNNDLSMASLNKKKKLIDTDDNDNEDAGVENLSFKEKLQLIERSSSRSLINPLSLLSKSKSISMVPQLKPLPPQAQQSLDDKPKDGSDIKQKIEEMKRDNSQSLLSSSLLSSVTLREKEKDFSRHAKSLNIEAISISERLEQIRKQSENIRNSLELSGKASTSILRNEILSPKKLSRSLTTAIYEPKIERNPLKQFTRSNSVQESSSEQQPTNIRALKIQLPTLDQGIDNFFSKVESIQEELSLSPVDIADFDEIKVDSPILTKRKLIQGPKRRRPTSTTRSLAHLRTDNVTEYTELVHCDSAGVDQKDEKANKFIKDIRVVSECIEKSSSEFTEY